jgi:hypothetical protein
MLEMTQDSAISLMQSYFSEQRHIDHTLKVLGEAERIMEQTLEAQPPADGSGTHGASKATGPTHTRSEAAASGFLSEVVRLSCIFHDIGIPNSIRTHGSATYQEQEGAIVADELLRRLGARADVRERLKYIVGHHHTRSAIDGFDFQVLWDADMIVNLAEGNVIAEGPLEEFVRERFQTEAGAARALRDPRILGNTGGRD